MADFQFVVCLDADEVDQIAAAANSKTFSAAVREHEKALRDTPALLTKLTKENVTSGQLDAARKSVARQRELVMMLTDSSARDEALAALTTADNTLATIVEAVENHHA